MINIDQHGSPLHALIVYIAIPIDVKKSQIRVNNYRSNNDRKGGIHTSYDLSNEGTIYLSCKTLGRNAVP